MEGRRVTAAIKDRYQTIVPVGSIIAITYQSPRENHGESQMKQKKASFPRSWTSRCQMLSVKRQNLWTLGNPVLSRTYARIIETDIRRGFMPKQYTIRFVPELERDSRFRRSLAKQDQ